MKKIIASLSAVFVFGLVFFGMQVALAGHNADGLAGYWTFDDGADPTADISGHGNNGALNGGTVYTTIGTPLVPGNVSALEFDGTDDFVAVAHDDELDMTSAYSISAWVNVTDIATYRPILFRGATNANDIEVYVQHTSGDLIVAHNRGNGGGFDYVGFVDPPAGLFHLGVTYDGTNVQAYYDGSPAGVAQLNTLVTAPLDTDKGWWIGKVNHTAFGGTRLFKGLIDEVRIYDRALNASEVEDVMSGDVDGDTVGDSVDLCPDTVADIPDVNLGTNRWMWDGTNWVTLKPKATATSTGWVNMGYTYGCSGEQILAELKEATGKDFEGHYKYGVSKSILEDWNVGRYYLETVTVDAEDTDGKSSLMSLLSGQDYIFRASGGTADACLDGCGYSILFDAEYSTSDGGITWVNGVAAPYVSYGPNLLDLMVNGGFVDWDSDAVYNADHVYEYGMVGTGAPVTFGVYDVYYPNNTGSLTVDIYADLW